MNNFLLAIFSCSDQNFNKSLTENEGAAPKIATEPSFVDFGLCTAEVCFQTLSVKNTGSGILQVSNMDIFGLNATSFSIFSAPQDLSFVSGETRTIQLAFSPTSTENESTLSISSNDSEQEVLHIPLNGQGIVPEILVIPNPLDMGEIGVGCTEENQILISNSGDIPVQIFSITQSTSPYFSIVWEEVLPITLEPQEFIAVSILFSATDIGNQNFEIHVFSDTPLGVNVVPVLGAGVAEYTEEEWVVSEPPKSDIMFSVDLSSSMSEEALLLGDQFQTFITELSNYTHDWQVMVVNADHGCNHSGILTSNTVNYEGIFADAVRTGAYDISFTEALLTNVTRGTEKSLPGQCNEGFMRENAMLHIIMLSDECEQSPNPGICGTQWQSYVDRIWTAKGDPNLVRISAIAGDYPSGCGNPQTAEFGSGYWESTIATGGTFLSICSDWTTPLSLQQLANTGIAQQTFALGHIPIETSISVFVNEVEYVEWIYQPIENAIELTGTLPLLPAEIKIQYAYGETCTQQFFILNISYVNYLTAVIDSYRIELWDGIQYFSFDFTGHLLLSRPENPPIRTTKH